jgi:hypothetical protein
MSALKGNKRGRRTLAWDPFAEELHRRFSTGEAAETMQDEAKYLAAWAERSGHILPGYGPLGFESIRNRMARRIKGGAQGYKSAREWHLIKLGKTPA